MDETDELAFLFIHSTPARPSRYLTAGAGSVAVHLLLAAILVSLPDVSPRPLPPLPITDVRKAVTLVAPRLPKAPPKELTQRDPNRGKVTRTLDVRSALPPVPAQESRKAAPLPAAVSPPPAPIEPPRIEIAANAPLPAGGGDIGLAGPAARPPQAEKPKLAFESIAAAATQSGPRDPNFPVPPATVRDAARAAVRPGGSGVSVGDPLEEPPSIATMSRIPSPGRMGSNLQLLSDPNGVDFKPYLIQVLAAVKTNWLAVIPESARLGRRGLVTIQFIVDRSGRVPKLVIATPSGTEAFDRAAVAGISASYPFPPLPSQYKGEEIRLQLAFSYNMAR